MTIKFKVDNQKLSYPQEDFIVSDSKNYITANFTFSDEWDGYSKAAQFSDGKKFYDVITDSDGNAQVPNEVLSKTDSFFVLVYGDKAISDSSSSRITTNKVRVILEISGISESAALSSETYTEQWSKLESKITGLKDIAFSGDYSDLTNTPTVDSNLSSTSENAIMNKAVNTALSGKQDLLSFDEKPTVSSENLVKSGKMAQYLNDNFFPIDAIANKKVFSSQAVYSKGDIAYIPANYEFVKCLVAGEGGNPYNSNQWKTLGNVYSELEKKQDVLTFDEEPIYGSSNPITSGAVRTVLDKKIDSDIFANTFVYETVYNAGDVVLWDNKFYRCRNDNTSGVIPDMPGLEKWDKFPDNFMEGVYFVSSKAGIDSICQRWMPYTSHNVGDIVYDDTNLNIYKLIKANPPKEPETGYPHLNTEYWAETTIANYVDYKIGNIETALNGIISLQNSYIGGEE